MNAEEKLKSKFGTETGFRVPEQYFDKIYIDISSKLPEQRKSLADGVSRWHRIRPYVYLAAMFAGIWCTMKMVNMMSGANNDVSLDNPPAFVAQAMTSSEVSDEFIMQSDVDNIEFTSDMAEEYTDIESFAKDFGYKFEDQYSNIDI